MYSKVPAIFPTERPSEGVCHFWDHNLLCQYGRGFRLENMSWAKIASSTDFTLTPEKSDLNQSVIFRRYLHRGNYYKCLLSSRYTHQDHYIKICGAAAKTFINFFKLTVFYANVFKRSKCKKNIVNLPTRNKTRRDKLISHPQAHP